jgi:hypothetical protein
MNCTLLKQAIASIHIGKNIDLTSSGLNKFFGSHNIIDDDSSLLVNYAMFLGK